jgi:hypothetical protein
MLLSINQETPMNSEDKKIKELIKEQYYGIGRNKTTQNKLWPLVVAATRGLCKPLFCAPWARSLSPSAAYTLPISYEHTSLNAANIDPVGKEEQILASKTHVSIDLFMGQFLGLCNEVYPINMDLVEEMARDIWMARQAMVFPVSIPLSSIAGSAYESILSSVSIAKNKDIYSNLTQSEAEELSIAITRMMQLCYEIARNK